MRLQIPLSQKLQRQAEDYVTGLARLVNQEGNHVVPPGLAVINQRERNGVTKGAVVPAGAEPDHLVDRSNRRCRVTDQQTGNGPKCLQVEMVPAPIDLEVVGVPQVTVEFKALGDR